MFVSLCFITTQLDSPAFQSTGPKRLNSLFEPSDRVAYSAYYSQEGLCLHLRQGATSDCLETVFQGLRIVMCNSFAQTVLLISVQPRMLDTFLH